MRQFLKDAGVPSFLIALLLTLVIGFPVIREKLQPTSKPDSRVIKQVTKLEPTFTTNVTPVSDTMLMITVEPTSDIKTANQTHDILADAFNRLNIQANDIVSVLPATRTEPALIITRYNSMLHSRAKEYEVKNENSN